MSVKGNKATLRRYYEEILNKGNHALWDELMTNDYVLRNPQVGSEHKGVEGNKEYYTGRKLMSSDSEFTIDEMIGEGDTVVITGALTGTNDGELLGKKPTGKKFSRIYVGIYRFKDGKIAEGWSLQDLFGFFRQLEIK